MPGGGPGGRLRAKGSGSSVLERALRIVHRGLGLLLLALLLAWTASGVAMTFLSADAVHADRKASAVYAVDLQPKNYASPGLVIAQLEGVTALRLKSSFDRVVYEATTRDGATLFDAYSGEMLAPLSEREARAAARRDFVGEAAIARAQMLTKPSPEYDGSTPVWKIAFDDPEKTVIYISPQTGETLARRDRAWRTYRFFRRMHGTHTGSPGAENGRGAHGKSAPVLWLAGFVALMFAMTGAVLIGAGFQRRR